MRSSLAVALAGLALGCSPPHIDLEGRTLRAFGNEPFWSVTIPVAGTVVYSRLGEADIAFPAEAPFETDSTLVYGPLRGRSEEHEITVTIRDEDCQDTMADIVHPMLSQVVIDGEELSGCARFDDPKDPGETP